MDKFEKVREILDAMLSDRAIRHDQIGVFVRDQWQLIEAALIIASKKKKARDAVR